ncbi:MAG: MFS transporter [Syntrophales bacterium]
MAEAEKATPQSCSPAQQNANWLDSLGSLLYLVGIFFINFLSRVILGPLLVVIEKDLHLTHMEAGGLFFFITLGYSFSILGSGYIACRLTHRQVIFISALGMGIAQFIISLHLPLWGVQFSLLLLGLTTGIYLPSGMATLTSIVKPQHWGKAVAVHELAPNLGFIAAPFLAEVFLRWSSWRGLLLVFSVISILLGLTYNRFSKGGDFYGEAPTLKVVSGLFRNPSFWTMMVMFGLGIATSFGLYSMLPLFLVSGRGLERTWANTLIALSRITSLFIAFAAGWFVDRWGVKKSLSVFFGATGILTIMVGIFTGSWLTIVVFLQPLVAVCFFPAGFTAISRVGPPELRNVAVSVTISLGYVFGGGFIPTFIGWAGEHGSFAGGIIGTGLFTLLCLPLIRKLKLTAITDQKQ